jgi:hypothetical protein
MNSDVLLNHVFSILSSQGLINNSHYIFGSRQNGSKGKGFAGFAAEGRGTTIPSLRLREQQQKPGIAVRVSL